MRQMRQSTGRGWVGGLLWVLVWLGLPALASAQDVTLTTNTTWSSNQVINGTLTLNSSVVLTLSSGADITATNLVVGSSARIDVTANGSVITASGTATLNSSARVEAAGRTVLQLRGGSWNLSGSSARVNGNADINVASLTVCSSCLIDASGRGEPSATGTAAGQSTTTRGGGGGGHGGRGGDGNSAVGGGFYGNPFGPVTAGSGGGRGGSALGGAGGGVLRVQVSGSLRNDGGIYANGGDGTIHNNCSGSSECGSGGGAGGSIWVTTNKLQGAGRFYAYGGTGYATSYSGGGGGGGLVYVDYATLTPDSGVTAFVRTSSTVYGGGGHAGFTEQGSLGFYDRVNSDFYVVDGWRFLLGGTYSYRDFSVQASGAHSRYTARVFDNGVTSGTLQVTATRNLTLTSGTIWEAVVPETYVTTVNASLTTAQIRGARKLRFVVSGAATMSGGALNTTEQLRLGGSGSWTLSSSAEFRSNDLFLDSAGSFSLGSGNWVGNIRGQVSGLTLTSTASTLNASGYGFAAQTGTGAGQQSSRGGSGGANGGVGGAGNTNNHSAAYYGSAYLPVAWGSGGGHGANGLALGGAGGGTINLTVTGTLNNSGYFYANGVAGQLRADCSGSSDCGGGGGAGGSILVRTGTLSGTGLFRSNGGSGYSTTFGGGGGGGGRVAVYYDTSTLSSPQDSAASGSSGHARGGDGTVLFVSRGSNQSSTADDTLYAYNHWRWQGNDGPHIHAGFVAYNSTQIQGPDTANEVLQFSGLYHLRSSAVWSPDVQDTVLSAQTFQMDSSSRILSGARTWTGNISATVTMASSAQLNAREVTVQGTNLNSTLTSAAVYGDKITWTGRTMTLANTSTRLDVNGRGSAAEAGTSPGRRSARGGSGGGHGGAGGAGNSQATAGAYNGLAVAPILPGSGGGHGANGGALGGRGGGVIRVVMSTSFVNSGYLEANGAGGGLLADCNGSSDCGGGGGAGGSIWVTTAALSGAGYFNADGGAGYSTTHAGGGGGGGRIAVHYDTGGMTNPHYISVTAGSGNATGEVGTMAYVHRAGTANDKTDDTIYAYEGWRWQSNDGPHTWRSFVSYSSTVVTGPDAANLTLSFSDRYELGASSVWYPNLFAALLQVEDLTMGSSALIDSRTNRAQLTNGQGLTLAVDGNLQLLTSSVINARTLTVTGSSAASLASGARVESDNVQWTGRDLSLVSNAYFSVNARGFAANAGTGRGLSSTRGGAGAGHGGHGGEGNSNTGRGVWTDSSTRPALAGSGGGSGGGAGGAVGGSGGGIIRVQLTGLLTLNGSFRADGQGGGHQPDCSGSSDCGGGGGAGGSIWVTTNTLAGAGYVRANGGAGYSTTFSGGGGAGGRIFVDYAATSNFTDRKVSTVLGGGGHQSGETGSLAFYDRTNDDLFIVEGWRWQQADGPFGYRDLTITGSNSDSSAWVRDDGNVTQVSVSRAFTMDSTAEWSLTRTTTLSAATVVLNNGSIRGAQTINVVVTGSTTMNSSATIDTQAIRFAGAGSLTMNSSARLNSPDIFLDDIGAVTLNSSSFMNGNIRGQVDHLRVVSTSAYLSADGRGFAVSSGPGAGAGSTRGGNGGSHGGVGGVGNSNGAAAAYYDTAYTPSMAGSGGGNGGGGAAGGKGGGTINLTVEGDLTVNGEVRADGLNGAVAVDCSGSSDCGGGGGAGGSVWMRAGALSGLGRFHARGGSGGSTTFSGGGGAGGRVAVYYNSGAMTTPESSTVSGRSGNAAGEVGTLVFIHRGANLGAATDDSLYVYEGWRWQANDGAHQHANFVAYDSTLVRGPDSAGQVLSFTGLYHLRSSATWQFNQFDTTLTTTNFQFDSSANIQSPSRTLRLIATGTGTMNSSSYWDVKNVIVTGTSAVTFQSSARVVSDNIQWEGRNLTLASTSSYFSVAQRGFASSLGTGQGGDGSLGGSGGGHGGRGGVGYSGAVAGSWYTSATRPTTAGSGGGTGAGNRVAGGAGGGIIRVQLTGELNIVGYMTANGENGARFVDCSGSSDCGSGGGAGGSIWVTVGTIKNGGYFNVNGGAGYSTTFSGGGGGGGRVFVEYVTAVSINPQASQALGGGGHTAGETGTIGFYERDVQDLWIVEGWRWQQGDAPFSYRNLKITDSTSDSSAWVRDDGNSVRVDVSDLWSMDSASLWSLTAPLTDVRAGRMDFSNGDVIGTGALSVTLGNRADLRSASHISSPSLRYAGLGNWFYTGGARSTSADMQFVGAGSVDLNYGYLYGNISGTLANLYLRSSSSAINADGYGEAVASGPGAGANSSRGGSGGSHGGVGGEGNANATVRTYYGVSLGPVTKGSGGGGGGGGAAGGAGGGVVALVVAGELLVNGGISVNGLGGAVAVDCSGSSDCGGGGGAGGSIWLQTDRLRKQQYGVFSARGGAGGSTTFSGGGGSGGRVLVAYKSAVEFSEPYDVSVAGGSGHQTGGLGTAAYLDEDDDYLQIYHGWRWEDDLGPYEFARLSAYNSATITADGTSMEIAILGACDLGSSVNWTQTGTDLRLDCNSLTLQGSSRIDAAGRTVVLTVYDTLLMQSGSFLRGQNLSMIGNAHLNMQGSATIYGNQLLAGRRLTMQSSSTTLEASGYGYAAQDGPGRGGDGSRGGSGGGHGGAGGLGYSGAAAGATYGDAVMPVTGGSGGGLGLSAAAGSGGGTIRMNFFEEVTLNGYVYANGSNGARQVDCSGSSDCGGGGGAGGSIWLETNSLVGTGRLYANGGAGYATTFSGGGGGGGRVAACSHVYGGFSGSIFRNGGSGHQNGVLGTYTVPADCDPILPDAAVVATAGARTPLSGVFAPSTTDVPVFQVRLREVTGNNNVTLRSLKFTADGSGNDQTNVVAVRLYQDDNSDGIVDEGEALLGTGTYTANNGTVTFGGLNIQINAQSYRDFVLVYDFGASISNNVTFRARLADYTAADMVVTNTTDVVPLYGAPAWGRSHRVYITPPPSVTYFTPQTVPRGVESFVTLHGYYFGQTSLVTLSDPARTRLTVVSIYNSNRRMGLRIPSNVPVGRWDILVTTPYGSNTSSAYKLQVQESCNTGLLGICAAGVDQGMGCVATVQPGTRSEVCDNGVDEDCNGSDLDCDLVDRDGDGFTPAEGDCNDTDNDIFPRDGLGCSAGRDDLGITGDVRAVVTYSPLDDGGDQSWTENLESSWYQQAADTLIDSSLQLTTQSDYAEITDSLFLQPFGDQLSVSTWVNIDELPTDGVYTVFTRGPFEAESYGIFYDAVHQCWVAVLNTVNGRFELRVTGYPIARRSWTHVALTYDGTQLRFVHNGVVRGSLAVTGAMSYGGASTVRVGGGHGSYRTWIGRIDEVCVFGRAVAVGEWSAMILANRNHVRYAWGNNGPAVRFSYDFGPHEDNRLIGGTFRGSCRVSGRSSLRRFPTFCSVVGTSDGFEIWDEPSGKLWARYWLNARLPGGAAIPWSSVDYTAVAGGRIYLGSNTDGIMVFDYVNDRVERWTTGGVSVFGGGVGSANVGRAYGPIDGNGLRLRTNKIRRLGAFARQVGNVTVPHVGVSCDEGVWVVRGGYGGNGVPAPYVSASYQARDDVYTPAAQGQYALFSGGGGWAVGDRVYYILRYQDNRAYDIVTSGLFYEPNFTDPSDGQSYVIDGNTAANVVNRLCAPRRSPTTYGGAVNPIWQSVITAQVNWGSVRDIVVFENASRNVNADGNDHMIALATEGGVVLLDQADSDGDTAPSYTILKSGPGVDTETEKYVLSGNVNDCTALGRRGGELFVGTQGAGVSRLSFNEGNASFDFVEAYTAESPTALPSNNVTAVSCGKNALVATDMGVASIRFPEPGPCDTGLEGVCASGRQYLVNNQVSCVPVVFASGEVCDNQDNDCDGVEDEHPEVGSICDVQTPVFTPIQAITITTQDCAGGVVALPTPVISDNNDPNPVVVNNAPSVFPFGTTTVTWQATDKDGNTSTTTSQVTVGYDGAPMLTVPEAVSAEAVSPTGTVVELGMATATICIDGGATVSNDAPVRFPLGMTTVTWTAQGQQGRAVTGTQVVTVTDTTPPSIEVGSDLTFGNPLAVTLPTPVISDNASANGALVVTHDAPQTWPIQEWTTVTYTVVDESGNMAIDEVRIYVENETYVDPVLVISTPEEGTWFLPPAQVLARVTDDACMMAPTATVNSQDLGVEVVAADGGWDVTTTRVSDGIHELTMTVTSGCSGRSVSASRNFGVDSGGLGVNLAQALNQEDVDGNQTSTWQPISSATQVNLAMVLTDNLSGLASLKVELVNHATSEVTQLHQQTITQRQVGLVPERGLTTIPAVGCSHETLCQAGRLQMSQLEGRFFIVRVTTEDVAGNEQVTNYYFQALGLREAIVAWEEAVRNTTSEDQGAQALLGQISEKLTACLFSYDFGYYGGVWLALEDSVALLRTAVLFDNGLDFDSFLALIASLAIEFEDAQLLAAVNEHGANDFFSNGTQSQTQARGHASGEAWQDVFTSLGNTWFWQHVGVDEMAVEDFLESPAQGYEDALELMTRLLMQMQAYLDASEDLPGREQLQEVVALLTPVNAYFGDVVVQGDQAQSDYEHVDALMKLGEAAVKLGESQERLVWVRNWRWGLSNIVALYAERALYNASTWILRDNPVWGAGQARFEEAEVYREQYRPDSYMETLIGSRCDIIGVYNAIYNPDYEVPIECCAKVREFHAMDSEYRNAESEIPIPEQCLETITVEITEGGFSPSTVRVSVGQGVKFINTTGVNQRIVGGTPAEPDADALDSGLMEPNAVYETSFDAAGTLSFFSSEDPDDLSGGAITVEE